MVYSLYNSWQGIIVCAKMSSKANSFMFMSEHESEMGFPWGATGKEPTCQCRRLKWWKFNSWVGKIPWKRAWQCTPVFLPGESHGQRRPAGYSLQSMGLHRAGHDWSDMVLAWHGSAHKSEEKDKRSNWWGN